MTKRFYAILISSFALNLFSQTVSHTPTSDASVFSFYYGPSLEKEFTAGVSLHVFQSLNTTFPYGHNDYGLWQGRLYNADIHVDAGYKKGSLRLFLNPAIYFSQNGDFSILPPSSWSGSLYGYFESGIDAPQRFGSDAFFDISPRNSVIRYLGDHWTVSVGSEKNRLGPGRYSQLLSGTSSDGFYRADGGFYNLNLLSAEWEFLYWFGGLRASEYMNYGADSFFSDTLCGFYLGIEPDWFPGFSIGISKTSQTAVESFSALSVLGAINFSFLDFSDFGKDVNDGKMNLMLRWKSESDNVQIYSEIMKEDYHPSIRELFLLPEHTTAFNVGFSYVLPWKNKWRMDFEYTELGWSIDYEYNGLTWGGGFYRHSKTKLGHTNEGQMLGSWTGSNSNMQIIRFERDGDEWQLGVFFERLRLDNTFVFTDPEKDIHDNKLRLTVPCILTLGCDYTGSYRNIEFAAEVSLNYYLNYLRIRDNDKPNLHLEFCMKY
ncbi:MAG: hypothetical protein JXB24_04220 [Bacteroidales bacterium]|nr:hypothetical protein [Bacteroidales bacterium]